jgi:adenosine deaminase
VNSDDPAYFGGYVLSNYLNAARALDLSRPQLVQLARNSVIASFLGEGEKGGWLQRIDALAA